MIKQFLITILFLGSFFSLSAQHNIEQLKQKLAAAKHEDTLRLRLLTDLSDQCEFEELDKFALPAIDLAEKLLKQVSNEPQKRSILRFEAAALNNISLLRIQQGKIGEALKEQEKSLHISEQLKDYQGMAVSYLNKGLVLSDDGRLTEAESSFTKSYDLTVEHDLKPEQATVLNALAVVYDRQGRMQKSLEYYFKSLHMAEAMGDSLRMGEAYNNLATFYSSQKQYAASLDFFEKSLKIRRRSGTRSSVAETLSNMGSTYSTMGDLKKAIDLNEKALMIRKEIGDIEGLGISLNNLGAVYRDNGNDTAALRYFNQAVVIFRKQKSEVKLSLILLNAGRIYLKMGEAAKAKSYTVEAFEIAQRLNIPFNLLHTSEVMGKIYRLEKNWNKVVAMQDIYFTMRDSLTNEATRKASLAKQFQYEYEVKSALQKAEHDKAIALAGEENKRQKIILTATFGVLALVLVIALVIFRTLRITRRQKNIIELQKKEVEFQKELVEEKQQELLDSINYARRIQNALITNETYIHNKLEKLNKG